MSVPVELLLLAVLMAEPDSGVGSLVGAKAVPDGFVLAVGSGEEVTGAEVCGKAVGVTAELLDAVAVEGVAEAGAAGREGRLVGRVSPDATEGRDAVAVGVASIGADVALDVFLAFAFLIVAAVAVVALGTTAGAAVAGAGDVRSILVGEDAFSASLLGVDLRFAALALEAFASVGVTAALAIGAGATVVAGAWAATAGGAIAGPKPLVAGR